MILLIRYTLVFATVLMTVALGGCISEHSGVINLGLEGIMVMGALGGALAMQGMGEDTPAIAVIAAVIIISGLSGMIYSVLLSVASINLRADQTLVGIAMNMLAAALATIIVRTVNISVDPSNVSSTVQYGAMKKYLVFNISSLQISCLSVFSIILLIAVYLMFSKTVFGLRLMACGEHPQAADSVGINVTKMRWSGVLISGFFGGLGGIMYITAGVSEWKFETGVAGFGFLALAVMIFGQWKPVNIALAALLFGFFRALSHVYTGFDFLVSLNIPSAFYNMMPYIISLIVLVFTSRNSHAPKAEGIPYDKGMR